jgi:5-methylcytosine-specific restriction endonuclease McrA
MSRRCTYCLSLKDSTEFSKDGDHIIPASMGGAWVDEDVCLACNKSANINADELIAKDPLVRFLREAFQVPDRYGKVPRPCQFLVRVPQGGGIKVTLHERGPVFGLAMSPKTAAALGLDDPTDQEALGRVVANQLDLEDSAGLESLRLAQAAQEFASTPTPKTTWSRFMAKLGLACGREAYGDSWLDSRQAVILSRDLLGSEAPRFGQRQHYPPVEHVWPYEPPGHRLWIELHDGTAVLMVSLFGQVLGAVPVANQPGPAGDPSAWSLDPLTGTLHRSTYPAIKYGTAVAKLTRAGHNVVLIDRGPDAEPFFFVEDGPDGPADMPIPTIRANSPTDALERFLHVAKGLESDNAEDAGP